MEGEKTLMPTKRGLRKLCDIGGSLEGAKRHHDALQHFLKRHSINYELSGPLEDPYGRPFWRYRVDARDLCCAQTVLSALREMQRGIREASA